MARLPLGRPEAALESLASVCPVGFLAESIQDFVASLLAGARLFLSPRVYARFSVSLVVYPAVGEVAALLLLPPIQALFVLSSLALVQVLPFLSLLALAAARSRSVEAEFPFFLVALSIMSKDSTPTIDEAFRRVAALGDGVFPSLKLESELLDRDLTFLPGAPTEVLASTLERNPSPSLKGFIHSFNTTITTGKSAGDYLEGEAQRVVGLVEARWRSFSESVGSLAEVSLMVLALFPVGVEMIAAAIPGFDSSVMLLVSMALLSAFSMALLLILEAVQPADHNLAPSSYYLATALASWGCCTLLFYEGFIPVSLSLLVPLAISAVGLLRTRICYDRIRIGEREISLLLHDLAEESKAGVSLPEALSRVSATGPRFSSIDQCLTAFQSSIMLGSTPGEAIRKLRHPSWLVRLSFGLLSIAFATGAGFEQLEKLSSFFKRVADARSNASRSLLPFVVTGLIVPVISVASMNFLGGLTSGGSIPFLPSFSNVSQNYILISISADAVLTGLILSKLFTGTSRHAVAIPLLLLSTVVSLAVFGVL